jgi:hypothetical protein
VGRTGDELPAVGPNKAVQSYSSKPGQLSAKQSADKVVRDAKKLNSPVTTLAGDALSQAKAKVAGDIAEREKKKLQAAVQVKKSIEFEENQAAQLLAQRMPASFFAGQPTDEQLFGHLVQSGENVQKAEQKFNNTMTNWFEEASKPISSRFSSPEEEDRYWASIKLSESSGE